MGLIFKKKKKCTSCHWF